MKNNKEKAQAKHIARRASMPGGLKTNFHTPPVFGDTPSPG